MCGINGFLQRGVDERGYEANLRRMATAQAHRGPDFEGVWLDNGAGVGLAHRRLSILDLSPTGHQPMPSTSGRFVVSFNGELYNFERLRDELAAQGSTFRGHGDTEVLLAAVERWGLELAVQRFHGMFAFALWDRETRTLHLVRDRLGEKPLYYGWAGDAFLFASELKALRAHPAFPARLDRNALTLLLRYNCIPAPYAIYAGVRKLPPATILTLPWDEAQPGAEPRLEAYWSAAAVATQGVADPVHWGDTEAIDQLETLLGQVVGDQMAADVPLGAFLSGGIDSSLIVAMMQTRTNRPIKTFTIGFEEAAYDEAPHARAVAKHLGTDHAELRVTPRDALDVIPRLPAMYDEPFADSSQIPTALVAKFARQHVTVSLSGDGGDELFAGYNRHLLGERVWAKMAAVPGPVRRAAGRVLTSVPPDTWTRAAESVPGMSRWGQRPRLLGEKLHKLGTSMMSPDAEAMYLQFVTHWDDPASVVLGAVEPSTLPRDAGRWPALDSLTHRMMYVDMVSYLPDDILVKVDRAAMSVALETRVPFLDPRVVDFAWHLPLSLKLRNGQSKWLLRQLLYRHVPEALIERPKMGFGVPIDAWLRGPLREWAEALLDERRLRADGIFDPVPIRRRWAEHLAGQRNWQHHLWDVLMFQAWLDEQVASGLTLQEPSFS